MKRPVIIVLSAADAVLAQEIAANIGGKVEAYLPRMPDADLGFDDVGIHLRKRFREGIPIIAIMASGAIIRLLDGVLDNKHTDPPVIAVASDGSSIVPLLSGHHGANDLVRKIAAQTGGHAAITTAGDIGFGVALDDPPPGYRLANRENAKDVMAQLLAGDSARLEGSADWLEQSAITFRNESKICFQITEYKKKNLPDQLIYHPQILVLGMGCERGADPAEATRLAEEILAQDNYAAMSLACIASLDVKADEPAIHAVAAHFGVPARFFDAQTLEHETARLQNPSGIVFAEVGCHGVAEGASLAAVGKTGELVCGKMKSRRVTAALARAKQPIVTLPGRIRGTLSVVGIGPGEAGWRSPEATRMIGSADDIVGYSLYLDLVEDIADNACRHDFPLGREEERVRHAMELAGKGRKVALVCSGDAGIYAMATLVFELLEKGGLSESARRIEIEVSPGISALQAAAARAGAPLGHDFCTISLSDLLTPWPDIERRVRAAGEGDFVIAFYNPVSRRRRTQLAQARDILLEFRLPETPVILATNLGRTGEIVRNVTLGDLKIDDVDMLTVVLVGSSQSRKIITGEGREWVYTPRGYAARAGTGIIEKEETTP
jgi:cobalt-precorrin 5A hydrolase / precorrin-3B C17-methyltransferase